MKNKSLTIKDISQLTTWTKKYKGMLENSKERMPSRKN